MGAERKSSFFLGFLALPKAKREALDAVYAYCRLIDDIADSETLPKDEARKMLDFWKEEIGRLYQRKQTHPVAERLIAPIETFGLDKNDFLEVIRGCSMDLEKTRYETFVELESYMQGVACAVGRLCVGIFGASHTSPDKIAEFAKNFGYAFQMTNIIRDVGADLAMDRIYMPDEDLRAAGYSREALLERRYDDAFLRLMAMQYDRAKLFYRRGRSSVDFRDRPAMFPAEVMAHVYEGLLDHIKESGFRVFGAPARQSGWVKAKHAAKAWLYCRGVHV